MNLRGAFEGRGVTVAAVLASLVGAAVVAASLNLSGDLTVGGNATVTGTISNESFQTFAGGPGIRLGTGAQDPAIVHGTGSPHGAVTRYTGSLYLRTDVPQLWQNDAAGTAWTQVGGSSGAAAFTGVRVTYAAQSVANTTETLLVSTTESFDTSAFHDNVTNTGRLTVPSGKAGYYAINCSVVGVTAATQNRIIVRLNSGGVIGGTVIAQAYTKETTIGVTHDATTIYSLAVGDEIQCTCTHNAGIAQNCGGAPSAFSMFLIGT